MKKAAAFGMTTQYHNRSKLSEELSGGAKYVSFEELLRTSDVLSLNLPLNVGLGTKSDPSEKFSNIIEEANSPHHINERVQADEERRCNCQHCPWCSD